MGTRGNNSAGRSRTDAEFCWFPHFSRLEASACEWVLCFSKDSGTEMYLLQQPLISYRGNKSSDSKDHFAPLVNVMLWRAKRKVADSIPKDKPLWCAKSWSKNGWEQKFSLHAARSAASRAQREEKLWCIPFLVLTSGKDLKQTSYALLKFHYSVSYVNWKAYCLRHVFS